MTWTFSLQREGRASQVIIRKCMHAAWILKAIASRNILEPLLNYPVNIENTYLSKRSTPDPF
jgi:hypothetical protein